MRSRTLHIYRNFDWLLFGAAVLLSGLGLLALYSIGLGQGDAAFYDFKKQLLFFVIGITIALVLPAVFQYRWLASMTLPLYAVMTLLLLAVLAFGRTIRGTTGWLYLGPVGLQPIELAKVVLIVITARFLSVHGRYTRDLRTVLQGAVAVVFLILLIILQPDLGGAIVLAMAWFAMIAVSGMKWKHVLAIFGVLVVVGVASWLVLLRPYQKQRIMTFLSPQSDPFGRGYNVTQSVIAIGAGKFTGRGIASGSQSQLRFLPEAPTDFIFSVIAEELGFIGVMVLLGLFGLMLSRLYAQAKRSRDDFTLFLIVGVAATIIIEAFINIGVASGIVPVTGIALPFVSYGGSSLITCFILIGLVENIAVRQS